MAEFPLSITILCYVAVALLALILIVLVRISGKISTVSQRLRRLGSRSDKSSSSSSATSADSESESESQTVEAGPGTPFEEFLNEDPKHRTLPKKDQFKEYRKWRAAKGLNWSK